MRGDIIVFCTRVKAALRLSWFGRGGLLYRVSFIHSLPCRACPLVSCVMHDARAVECPFLPACPLPSLARAPTSNSWCWEHLISPSILCISVAYRLGAKQIRYIRTCVRSSPARMYVRTSVPHLKKIKSESVEFATRRQGRTRLLWRSAPLLLLLLLL